MICLRTSGQQRQNHPSDAFFKSPCGTWNDFISRIRLGVHCVTTQLLCFLYYRILKVFLYLIRMCSSCGIYVQLLSSHVSLINLHNLIMIMILLPLTALTFMLPWSLLFIFHVQSVKHFRKLIMGSSDYLSLFEHVVTFIVIFFKSWTRLTK